MANEFVAKNGLISQNNTVVSGSLTTTGLQVAKSGTQGFAHRTTDYVAGTAGTSLFTGLGAATGNTYGIISVRTSGGSSAAADLILNSNGSGRVAVGTSKTSANATLDVFGNTIITGSLSVTAGVTASLQGTASFATTASYALTSAGGSGLSRSISSVAINTAAGSAVSTDYVYLASSTITITLPTAVGNTNRYTIKNAGSGVISIATTSSQTIDDSASPITINTQYVSLDLISDGTNWEII